MSAALGIQCFLATASGPATLCRQLRGRTLPLRSLPRSARAIHFVESRFADELFGEQLLSILSDKLRLLLQAKDAIAVASPRPSPAPSTDFIRAKKPAYPQAVTPSQNTSAETPFKADLPHQSDSLISGRVAAAQALALWERAASKTKDNPIPFDASSRVSGESAASPDAHEIPARAKSTAVPLIVKLIQQYWNHEALKQKYSAYLETQPAHIESSSPFEPGNKTDAERTRKLPPEQISDRMRAFISGPFLRTPLPRTSDALVSVSPPNPVPDIKEPSFAVSPRLASNRNDFEEKLVDILREQAIHHGIDIS